ncbi:MAG: gamma-glutamylcyclotransferase [Mesorhizobium sp.]
MMALTEEMVALCHRDVVDIGPEPGLSYLDENDYIRIRDSAMAVRPAGPIWLFAYGSLIWKPEVEHVEERVATARGYHRAFCIHQTRWRGTLEQPGLMMGLMHGGQCRGIAFRVPNGDPAEVVSKLIRREMTAKPSTYLPTWLKLDTSDGPLSALGFVVNPNGQTSRQAQRCRRRADPGASLRPYGFGRRFSVPNRAQPQNRAASMIAVSGDCNKW